ncbi:antibiotic biosynthesis monooxygenase [Brachybacterium sp. AOP25-B2-12]|uniref:antibiotic biosynthesis monooxygenase n=1 Tax=Brachybacterium sp. AOP25-B2-12 TaxID=3457710 RepID=UPI004034A6B0
MSEPVTVQISRTVDPEAIDEMEAWVADGQRLASMHDGYLGSGWVRNDPTSTLWLVLYRFADAEQLERWETSEARRTWLESFADHVQLVRSERRTGIEGWFDTPAFEQAAADDPAPARWKQMIVIFTGFFPMSLLGNVVVSHLVPHWPIIARVLLVTVLVMPLMVYLVLPAVTALCSPFLTGRPRAPRGETSDT